MRASSSNRKGERGIAILMAALLLMLAVPLMGLMFDSSLLFIMKARLQGAVDGAALAGARALAKGADFPSQISTAQSEAAAFVRLNYPEGYLFSGSISIPTPAVDLSVPNQRTISVGASVPFPGLFLRSLYGTTTVAASASATR